MFKATAPWRGDRRNVCRTSRLIPSTRMKTSQLAFGIVGPGMIAGVVADAIAKSKNAKLTAVSSRSIENAKNFVASRPGAAPVEGVDALLERPDVQAIYLATPTVAKEEIT